MRVSIRGANERLSYSEIKWAKVFPKRKGKKGCQSVETDFAMMIKRRCRTSRIAYKATILSG